MSFVRSASAGSLASRCGKKCSRRIDGGARIPIIRASIDGALETRDPKIEKTVDGPKKVSRIRRLETASPEREANEQH